MGIDYAPPYKSRAEPSRAESFLRLDCKRLRLLTLPLALGLWACDSPLAPEAMIMRWEGVAVPIAATVPINAAMIPTAAGMMADTTAIPTFVAVEYEHTNTTDRILGTYTIWQENADPCGLEWLPRDDASCWYMTEVEGVQIPFEMPTSRFVRMVLPVLGQCTLTGLISYPGAGDEEQDIVWAAIMRCGDNATAMFAVDLKYEPEYR